MLVVIRWIFVGESQLQKWKSLCTLEMSMGGLASSGCWFISTAMAYVKCSHTGAFWKVWIVKSKTDNGSQGPILL